MSERDQLLTVKEVADRWRVDERTVRRWVALGRLKAMRIGRTLRFRPAAVNGAAEKYRDAEMGARADDPAMG